VPRYLQMIHESADDALGYIRHYLEARAGATGEAGELACANLGDTLRWLRQRYEMQLEARGISVTLKLPADDAHVAIDERVLRQLGENLVTNAMKYAPGTPLVLAGRRGAKGFWQLLAADGGPGIPKSQQRELFKPFTRLQQPDDGISSGLGLSLAKQIVTGAGGHLWYEDREGGGACFVIELPEAEPEADCDSTLSPGGMVDRHEPATS
jgi:two-component system sensor histidine kinase/response regulator